MDKMSIINMLTVGVPEIALGFCIILLIFQREKIQKERKYIFIFKLILSTTITMVLIRFSRKNVSNIMNVALISTLIYSVVFVVIWNFNIRKSILSGCLIMFILILAENTTTFPINQLILNKMTSYNFLDMIFIWSVPTRIIQILIIILIFKFKISLENHILLNLTWGKLSSGKKLTCILLMLLMILSIYFNSNYGDIFIKLKTNDIDVEIFNINLIVIFIQTIIYIVLTMIILNRTTNYENYKKLLYSDKDEIMKTIIDNSCNDDLIKFVAVASKTIERRCGDEKI